MLIRKSTFADLDEIMRVYAAAKQFMDANGNPTQWIDGYPVRAMVEEDIRQGVGYVCEENGIHGAFAFIAGDDPTYHYIEDGAWLNDEPYSTIHRVGSDGVCSGIVSAVVAYCKSVTPSLRIDTHHNNHVMQHLIEKNGFQRCGVIYVDDGSPRIAYQLPL